MKQPRPYLPWLVLAGTLPFSSCNRENQALIEKREQQKAEIIRLRGELALLDEKLKNTPEDMSPQLAEAEKLLKEQNAEVASLEKETAELDAKRRTLQQDFDAYRAKYPAK